MSPTAYSYPYAYPHPYPAAQHHHQVQQQPYSNRAAAAATAAPPAAAAVQQPVQLLPLSPAAPYSLSTSASTSSGPHQPQQRNFCSSCNIRFKDDIHRIAHQRNEHVRCTLHVSHGQGGECTFEGMPGTVEIHEQDRHLIFRPGARLEQTKPDGPPDATVIQGTNVRLETEEDVQKWIQERRRKWPGSKNAQILVSRCQAPFARWS